MCPQPFLSHAWSDFGQTWQKHSTWWYTRALHFILWCDQRWPTGGHFSCKKKKHPDVEHVLNHFSDIYLPMLFKPGTQKMNDGLHMHVIFFEIRSKMADWWPFCYWHNLAQLYAIFHVTWPLKSVAHTHKSCKCALALELRTATSLKPRGRWRFMPFSR